jgi:hypothetical protein
MRKTIIFCILISCISCKQNANTNNKINNNTITILKEKTMERFDIEKFKKNASGKTYYEFNNDDAYIVQYKENYGYREVYISFDNEYFQTDKSYNEKGILFESVTHYRYSNLFGVGIRKFYNQQGELVREEDYDKGISYDWNKILEITQDYKIDLKDSYTNLDRIFETKNPYWELSWVIFGVEGNHIRKTIIIDAKSYEIIKESETPFGIIE